MPMVVPQTFHELTTIETVLAGVYWPRLSILPAELVDGPLSPLNILAILAAAAIIYIGWQGWRLRPRVDGVIQEERSTPPDDLHPALAGALASGNVDYSLVEATLIDMIRRGVVCIEPDDAASGEAQVRILDDGLAGYPFEKELLRLMSRRANEDVVSHRDLLRLRTSWGSVCALVRQELEDRGWFDSRSSRARFAFTVPGLIGLTFALLLVVLAITERAGWLTLGSLILGLVAAIALGLGSIFPSTTRDGERHAIPWRGYRAGLARRRRDASIDEIDLDREFPYIIAMKMAAQFDNILLKSVQSGYIPAWMGKPIDVAQWPEPWYRYWISIHSAIAPTDATNSRSSSGSATRRFFLGGR